MVGASLANDVTGPRSVRMRALRITGSADDSGNWDPAAPALARFEDLAWLGGVESGVLTQLASPGMRVRLGELAGTLERLALLDDGAQGRYNLVARVAIRWDEGWTEEAYLKRYRHPEAVAIEEIARTLLAEVGIETNRVSVQPGE